MYYRSIDEGLQSDFSVGRTVVEGDSVLLLDASVDGQGGTIRDKPVWDVDQIAFQLNRGEGVKYYEGVGYNSGANWDGAQGTANNQWYWLPVTKAQGGEAGLLSEGGPGATGPLTTLTFGFYETLLTLPEPYIYQTTTGSYAYLLGNGRGGALAQGFSAFSSAQREAARQAIASWDELIDVSFVETPFSQGDINFMNTTTGPVQASAYLPYDYGSSSRINYAGDKVSYYEIAGDIFVNPNQSSNFLFDEGQYGMTTLVHEIGHSLGLEHPGEYNFGPGFAVTYENGAEYYQDSRQYSIMSYWDGEETGAAYVDWEFLTYRYSSTPNVHDIAAIQRIYGADMTTRTGDDTYGFNMSLSSVGRNDDGFNFVETPHPVVTIWDAGGNDTLDLSGYDTPSIIDLNPGAFSSAGGFLSAEIPTLEEINARRAEAGLPARTQATYDLYVELFGASYTNGLMRDNISIAYNVTIENAVGGGGDDSISGNSVANVLTGNGGDDTLMGRGGDDSLLGGIGSDTATYVNAGGSVTINLAAGTATGADGNDTLDSIENAIGSAYDDIITGSAVANILNGGAGVDTIRGGDGLDVATLGDGDDFFLAEVTATKQVLKTGSMSVDIITDFDAAGNDTIDLSGLGVAMSFRGTAASKKVGDLTYKTYDSLNGAENALGFDIDGQPGAGGIGGPVTVVYGNLDGGKADFAIILLNTSSVDASDFDFGDPVSAMAAGGGRYEPDNFFY